MKNDVLKKIRAYLAKQVLNLSEQVATNGTTIVYDGDAIVEGGKVYTYDGDGNQIPLANGNYELEDGQKLAVENGTVKSIDKDGADAQPLTEEQDGESADESADASEAEADNQLSAIITQLIDQITALNAKIEALTGNQTAQDVKMSAISKEFEELKKTPVATSLSSQVPSGNGGNTFLDSRYSKAIENLSK